MTYLYYDPNLNCRYEKMQDSLRAINQPAFFHLGECATAIEQSDWPIQTVIVQDLINKFLLALVRSQLSYCSQLWRPRLMKDIVYLEKVQRRASKYILGDRESDYRSRLITLNLLCINWLELQDLIFGSEVSSEPLQQGTFTSTG